MAGEPACSLRGCPGFAPARAVDAGVQSMIGQQTARVSACPQQAINGLPCFHWWAMWTFLGSALVAAMLRESWKGVWWSRG